MLPIGLYLKLGAALLVAALLATGAWWIHSKLSQINDLKAANAQLTQDVGTAKNAAAESDAAAQRIRKESDDALQAVRDEHTAADQINAANQNIGKELQNALPADLICPVGKTGAIAPAYATAFDKLFGYDTSAGLHPANQNGDAQGSAGVSPVPIVAHGH